jgi:tetratricopeptide (TPR) repeat protein
LDGFCRGQNVIAKQQGLTFADTRQDHAVMAQILLAELDCYIGIYHQGKNRTLNGETAAKVVSEMTAATVADPRTSLAEIESIVSNAHYLHKNCALDLFIAVGHELDARLKLAGIAADLSWEAAADVLEGWAKEASGRTRSDLLLQAVRARRDWSLSSQPGPVHLNEVFDSLFGRKFDAAHMYTRLGLQDVERWEQVAAPLLRDRAMYTQPRDAGLQALASSRLGALYQGAGRWEEAEEALETALSLYAQLDDIERGAYTYLRLGVIHKETGRWAQAQQSYKMAGRLNSQLGNVQGQATGHLELGDLHQNTGRWNEAKNNYEKALNLYTRLGFPEDRDCPGFR